MPFAFWLFRFVFCLVAPLVCSTFVLLLLYCVPRATATSSQDGRDADADSGASRAPSTAPSVDLDGGFGVSCSTEVVFGGGRAGRRSCSTEVVFDGGHIRWRSCSMEVMFDGGHFRCRSC